MAPVAAHRDIRDFAKPPLERPDPLLENAFPGRFVIFQHLTSTHLLRCVSGFHPCFESIGAAGIDVSVGALNLALKGCPATLITIAISPEPPWMKGKFKLI